LSFDWNLFAITITLVNAKRGAYFCLVWRSNMALPTRSLGSSGLHITTVGFGSWAIGGGGWAFGWGPQDDAESVATMRHAIDLGVNWIDTAAVYGLGHSEEVVGKLLRESPSSSNRPLIFTKCGLTWDVNNPMQAAKRSLKPETIRQECEASLRRLGVERIDLYQFHRPDETGTPVEDSWATMVKLVDEGKVRAIGVSNFNVDLLERCEAIRHVDSLQPPFSMINRTAAEKLLSWCKTQNTGVICYSPMQSGILTDGFTADRVAKMADDDWRRRGREFQEPNLSRNIALRNTLRPIAARYGVSVASIAIAWTLSWPGVSGAIVGARTPAQVDGWIEAAALELTQSDLSEIATAIEKTEAGTGPSLPPKLAASTGQSAS
jgi:aryl-alcohol dehydrogenase-like predicted oxidoreductase